MQPFRFHPSLGILPVFLSPDADLCPSVVGQLQHGQPGCPAVHRADASCMGALFRHNQQAAAFHPVADDHRRGQCRPDRGVVGKVLGHQVAGDGDCRCRLRFRQKPDACHAHPFRTGFGAQGNHIFPGFASDARPAHSIPLQNSGKPSVSPACFVPDHVFRIVLRHDADLPGACRGKGDLDLQLAPSVRKEALRRRQAAYRRCQRGIRFRCDLRLFHCAVAAGQRSPQADFAGRHRLPAIAQSVPRNLNRARLNGQVRHNVLQRQGTVPGFNGQPAAVF